MHKFGAIAFAALLACSVPAGVAFAQSAPSPQPTATPAPPPPTSAPVPSPAPVPPAVPPPPPIPLAAKPSPSASASASPSGSASPAPATSGAVGAVCAEPNRPPSVIAAKAPRIPGAVQGNKISGLVSVDVQLDDAGRVLDATATSGPTELRDAAVQSARGTTYAYAVANCVPIPSVYAYRVFFQ